jgi:Clr5 domain
MDFVMDDSSFPGEVTTAIPSGNSYPLAVQGLNSSLAPLTSGSNHSIGFGGPFPSHCVDSLHHEPPLDRQGTGVPAAEIVTPQLFGGNIEEPPFQDGLVRIDRFPNMLDTEAATSSPRSQLGVHPARNAETPNNAFAASEFRDTGHVATFPLMLPPVPLAPPVLPIPADMNASSGSRRTEQEWASHHNIIRKLYIEDNLTLASTVKIMKTRHGFNAS